MALQRILIIDDDDDIRGMFVDLLSEEGYEVIARKNGTEGLQAFNESNFDLVLCDLVMPGIGGIEVLRKIREDSKVPCIILSGQITPRSHKLCTLHGANDIFEKPIDYSYLKLRIKSIIES